MSDFDIFNNLYEGDIEQDHLVLKKLEFVPTQSGSSHELKMAAPVRYDIPDLSKEFSMVRGFFEDGFVSLRKKQAESIADEWTVSRVSFDDLAVKLDDYAVIPVIDAGTPFAAYGGFESDESKKKVRGFLHKVYTEAAQNGVNAGDIIKTSVSEPVPKDFSRNEHDTTVLKKMALVLPSEVAYIEDRGAYRAINTTGGDEWAEIYSLSSRAELEQALGKKPNGPSIGGP